MGASNERAQMVIILKWGFPVSITNLARQMESFVVIRIHLVKTPEKV